MEVDVGHVLVASCKRHRDAVESIPAEVNCPELGRVEEEIIV